MTISAQRVDPFLNTQLLFSRKNKKKSEVNILELFSEYLTISRISVITIKSKFFFFCLAALTFAMPVELIGSRVADMVVNSCQSSSSSPNTSSSLSSAMQAAINGTANRVDESVLLDQWTTMSKSVLNQVAGVLSNVSVPYKNLSVSFYICLFNSIYFSARIHSSLLFSVFTMEYIKSEPKANCSWCSKD